MGTPISGEFDDWDRPFTEEELQEIDAAFQSATKRRSDSEDVAAAGEESRRKSRRRLPESLFVYHQQNEASNSSFLSPCTSNRSRCSYSYRSSNQAKFCTLLAKMGTPISGELDDWDRPFTEEELQEIDAAFQSATKRRSDSEDVAAAGEEYRRKSRRRLPASLFDYHQQNEASNSSLLSPCTRNQSRCGYSYLSSNQAKLVMQYPEMTFKGRVIYSRTIKEVEKSAVELLNFVEEKKRKEGDAALGFDIEWKPSFRRGVPPGKAAVMQICGDKGNCYVLHIIHSGIPQTLQSLLEDPTVVKVGVCIANDAYKVRQDHNVSVKALEDLSELANKKIDDPKKWSLASLTEKLLAKQLPKPSNIRLGNWEANVLSRDQLHYAATDAFVSWHLYQALKSLPEIVDNKE